MRRILSLLSRLVTFFLFRRVEVAGRDLLPRDRPLLLVANHFNGLVDPLLLAAALSPTPRFLAKATLAKVVGVGPLLRACGVIFVHRPIDGAGTEGNRGAFAAAARALVGADVVAIFPEGTTHDRPHIDPLRTGAARIALGARAAGAKDLAIVPVGLTFTDKVSLRSTALVQFGPPVALDDLVGPHVTDLDTDAVRAATARIEDSLRLVSPDFPDVETWLAFDQAAEVTSRTRQCLDPPLAGRAELARRLVRAPEEAQQAVRSAVGRYATVLSGLRIEDRDVLAPANTTEVLRRAVLTGLLVVVLGSLVGATILVNAIPTALIAAVSLLVTRPVTKGTVRVLLGLIAFPAAWITAATLTVDGAGAVAWLVLVFAAGAAAAIALSDRALALVEALLRWRLSRERIATLGDAVAIRTDVVASVEAALVAGPEAEFR
ncbi:MAG TPA: 1-acyl-sn-glycerol-3-phosphate acyltransferase [Euzebya sp.]|nr:1-acyl-sn-glycerol-3-phosphate acyltransferase [Euzebya sp.]